MRVESELEATWKATTDGKKLLKESEEEIQAAKVESRQIRNEKDVVEAK